jgi:translocation and assembly module TamB
MLAFVVMTERGLQTAASLAQSLSGGALEIRGVHGRLQDDVRIDHLRYVDQKMQVDASDVHLRWHPRLLVQKKLSIDALEIVALTVATKASDEPAKMPASLQLPITIEVRQAAIGRLTLAQLNNGVVTPHTELTALTASLTSNAHHHHLQARLTSPWGQLQTDTQLATATPFAIAGSVNYSGQPAKAAPQLGLQATLSGNLELLRIVGKADATRQQEPKSVKKDTVQGDLQALITPFAPVPLREFKAQIADFNPADFIQRAPQANLSIAAEIKPDSKSKDKHALAGQIKITNSRAGAISQDRFPVQQLQTNLHWGEQRIAIEQFKLQLLAQARVQGDATIQLRKAQAPQVDATVRIENVDLKQLHEHLQASNIKGSIQVSTSDKGKATQQINLQARLSDPRAQLNLDADYAYVTTVANAEDAPPTSKNKPSKSAKSAPPKVTYGVVNVSRVELISDDAKVTAKGNIALGGSRNFALEGNLFHFDPARWVAGSSGKIDGQFKASGQLQPRWRIALDVPQLQGQYAGQNIAANINLTAAQQPQGISADIQQLYVAIAKNTLNASGQIGVERGKSGASQELVMQLNAPDLAALSAPLHQPLSGSLTATARLSGRTDALAISLQAEGNGLQTDGSFSLGKVSAKLNTTDSLNGNVDASVQIQDLRSKLGSDSKKAGKVAQQETLKDTPPLAQQLSLTLNGQRENQRININAVVNDKRRINLLAQGGFREANFERWQGALQQFEVTGRGGARLLTPMPIDASAQRVQLGATSFGGELGQIALEQLEWTPTTLSTRGSARDVRPIDLLNLFKRQFLVEGDLRLNANWNVMLAGSVRGEIAVQRQSGDISIADAEAAAPALPLGLSALEIKAAFGGLIPGTDGERITINAMAEGARVGSVQLNASSALKRAGQRWVVTGDAPVTGALKANIPDLQWIAPWLSPGLSVKGKLAMDGTVSGTVGSPRVQASIAGRELEVAFSSEGVLLPNGILDAKMDGQRVIVERLQFSNTINSMPRHAQFREIDLRGQRGELNASGEVDLGNDSGNIKATWTQFPMLQRSDRWLVLSGELGVTQTNATWNMNGKLIADGAFFRLPKFAPPSLSEDVVVINRKTRNGVVQAPTEAEPPKKVAKSRLDITLDMGPRFVFVGRGLDTTLAGNIRLRAADGGALQATGSIRTDGGTYEGYGQQLTIERGIVNFQGSPSNPGLNIRALRLGLAVEAGVEVTGTVSAPQVRLVSEPSVPDSEKLSWLVLGRGTEQLAGGDASLLLSAAGVILGGGDGRNLPRDIVQGLGFDEFSVGTSDQSNGSKIPTRTVAGSTTLSSAGTSSGDQVVSVGKRLAPGLVLSVERGLSDASGALKLSWQLTRRVSMIARSGTDSSVDAYYTFSFD